MVAFATECLAFAICAGVYGDTWPAEDQRDRLSTAHHFLVELVFMLHRIATEADATTLAKMRWDFQFEEPHAKAATVGEDEFVSACADFLAQGFKAGEWVCWLAECDGEIVSHLYVNVIRSIPRVYALESAWGNVRAVYTRPADRNKGVGRDLLESAVQWAKAQKLELLTLWPSAKSVTFYERGGFPRDLVMTNKLKSQRAT